MSDRDSTPHAGQTFVLTGELDIERSDAAAQLKALGARVTKSVSGKTTALLCGSEPGASKIAKAESKGIPVVDTAGVKRLLAGEPLEALSGPPSESEEAAPASRTPLPDFPERADGPYRVDYPGTDQAEYEGAFENGRRVGEWKRYHPNGQLAWRVSWVDGQRQGPIEAFYDNGQKHYVGEYLDDAQHGAWEYWYDDGPFMQRYFYERGEKTGDYVCDERDGSPRARGTYRKNKLHGQWEWRNQKHHELVKRGYRGGAFHGMNEAWYPGGQLAYRKEYEGSGLVGVVEEYYPDGKPKKKGQYDKDRQLVRMESWDEDGNHSVEEGEKRALPEKLLGDAKKLDKLAARLKKAKDEYKKDDVLEKAAGDWQLRYPLLMHLFREGHYDLGADPSLWRFLADEHRLLTGEDVARVLKTAKPNENTHCPILQGWPGELETMVMRVYARDPEPIRAALPELDGKIAIGVKTCLRRFGEDVKVPDQAKALADTVVNRYGLPERVLWPADGGVEERRLYVGHRRAEPSEHYGAFLETYTDVTSFEEALMAATMAACEDGKTDLSLAPLRPALVRATTEQLRVILEHGALGDMTVEDTERALLEWRDDDAATLTEIALASEETGLRRWPMVSCAILKHAAEGSPIPDALVDALPLDMVSISTQWIVNAIQQTVPEKQRDDPDRLADAVVFADRDSPGCPRSELLMRAFRALSPEQRERRLRAQLESQYAKVLAAPYLFMQDDEALWKEAIELFAEMENVGHSLAFGLGTLPLRALPLILAGHDAAPKKSRNAWEIAALLCATRGLERGEALDDETVLRVVRFDVGGPYDWTYVMPILRKAVHVLPRAQGEKVLLAGLGARDAQTFARAFRFIGSHPSRAVMEAAMHGLVDREATLKSEGERDVEAGLKSLPELYVNERRGYVKWLLQNGAGSKLKRAFEQAVGGTKTFQAIEKELAEGGAEVAKELDKVDKLLLLAERARKKSGDTEPIYVMRELEEPPAEATLNRTGGPPPGVDAERWPTYEDEPMVPLFTLDLDTMPELQARHGGARTLTFFCYSPSHNEAYEPGNGQTAVLTATHEEAGATHEPPEDAEVRDAAPFEVIRLEVPSAVFGEPTGVLKELRDAIYLMGARALGAPLWMQGDEGGSAGFVMQLDESFVDVNLGDMGIMYVYDDGGFWQCG